MAEAAGEASRLMAEAQAKADNIKKDFEARARTEEKNILARAGKEAERNSLEILIPARLARKSAILQEKHRILDDIFKDTPGKVREKKETEVIALLYG
ncbi:MAG: hypothetical protein KKH83_02650 [Candidatus Margulisbacteria bacterium]|nr:hypothetical protein [Candidatus Margulisiibacteriota bacterium]